MHARRSACAVFAFTPTAYPATMPDGQGQVSHFALNAVDRIEVLRGPFSALYGNSSGGVIAMTTRLASGPTEFEVSGAAGSYDTWRAGINISGGDAPYAYAIDASRFSTDGYRDYSSATRDVVNLRAAALDTPLGRLRITLNALDIPEAEDPLGLTRAQWQEDPRQASPQALQFRTRKSTEQQQLGAQLAGDFAAALELSGGRMGRPSQRHSISGDSSRGASAPQPPGRRHRLRSNLRRCRCTGATRA